MVGERHAVVKKDGKEVQYNVNRSWKHQQWDGWHPDTGLTGKEEVKSQKGVIATERRRRVKERTRNTQNTTGRGSDCVREGNERK
jgi:hypothetical protein